MIVICEECGKKYRIDPNKIRGRAASFKCRQCSHFIMVRKPEAEVAVTEDDSIDQSEHESADKPDASAAEAPAVARAASKTALKAPVSVAKKRRSGFGLHAGRRLLGSGNQLRGCPGVDCGERRWRVHRGPLRRQFACSDFRKSA